MADENQVPDTSWSNPFLRNMPMVAIVRQKVVRNGEVLYSPDSQSKRVFFRVPNNREVPAAPLGPDGMPQEIMPASVTGAGGSLDQLYGFNDLKPF